MNTLSPNDIYWLSLLGIIISCVCFGAVLGYRLGDAHGYTRGHKIGKVRGYRNGYNTAVANDLMADKDDEDPDDDSVLDDGLIIPKSAIQNPKSGGDIYAD